MISRLVVLLTLLLAAVSVQGLLVPVPWSCQRRQGKQPPVRISHCRRCGTFANQPAWVTFQTNSGEDTITETSNNRDDVWSSPFETSDNSPPPPDNNDGLPWAQRVENVKCIFLGIGVGIWSVLPFTALHYFVYQPTYTSVPQWEWDTYCGAIQGALCALVYRYMVRPEQQQAPQQQKALSNQVVQSFVGVRTLSRIQVSMTCTALPLYCGDVLRFLSWQMAGDLTVNYVESAVLFGAVTTALQKALDQGWVRPYYFGKSKE